MPSVGVLLDAVGDLARGCRPARCRLRRGPGRRRPTGSGRPPGRPCCRRCSSSIRRWPSDSLRSSPAWTLRDRSSESCPSSSRSASAQASSEVSRVIVCSRMPKRTVASLVRGELADPLELLAHRLGRLAPGQVDVGVPGGDVERRPATSRRSRPRAPGRGPGRGTASSTCRCVPSKSTISPAPQAADDVEELAAPHVAAVLVEEVAVRRCSWLSPPVTTLSSSRPPVRNWKVPAICAARVGEVSPGRKATRNFSRSVRWLSIAVVIQASSHQAPVGRERGLEAERPPRARAIWPR